MSISRVRKIEAANIADLIQIAEDTNLNRWTAQNYLDELKNPLSIMVRLESETLQTVGFIVGRVVAATDSDIAVDAEIYNIGVSPEFQRKGFGQALIDTFFDSCRERSVRYVWLEVRERNEAAIGLYVQNGFIPITIRKDFYNDPRDNGILMRCAL